MSEPITLQKYLIAVSLLIVGAFIKYLFDNLQPRSRVVVWSPHSFLFDNIQAGISIYTQNYTIQNLGRKSAEDIEIVHRTKPDYFKLQPERLFTEHTTPTGEHIIKIDSLGPKEFFSVEILSYIQIPDLILIRSKDGQVRLIQFLILQIQPRWRRFSFIFFMLMGLGATGYLFLKLAAALLAIL